MRVAMIPALLTGLLALGLGIGPTAAQISISTWGEGGGAHRHLDHNL